MVHAKSNYILVEPVYKGTRIPDPPPPNPGPAPDRRAQGFPPSAAIFKHGTRTAADI
eukprot:SAG31_NODE_22012_length_535_cov_6.243119_1_plen_56_part_10